VARCARRRAVVVQLDLCGFTALARALGDPLALARLVHGLFARFDAAVAAAGLARVDTVGDAYIAAGFLPAPAPAGGGEAAVSGGAEGAAEGDEEAAVCAAALDAARAMLDAVAACRRETGRAVACRIGVCVGEVVAAALGTLQVVA
jgi:class 3 adenylate cyclase